MQPPPPQPNPFDPPPHANPFAPPPGAVAAGGGGGVVQPPQQQPQPQQQQMMQQQLQPAMMQQQQPQQPGGVGGAAMVPAAPSAASQFALGPAPAPAAAAAAGSANPFDPFAAAPAPTPAAAPQANPNPFAPPPQQQPVPQQPMQGQLVPSVQQSNPYAMPPPQQQPQPQQQQQLVPSQPQPQPPAVVVEDDDFFGDFSANKPQQQEPPPTPATPGPPLREIDGARAYAGDVSVVSGYTTAADRTMSPGGGNRSAAAGAGAIVPSQQQPPRGGGGSGREDGGGQGGQDGGGNNNAGAIVPAEPSYAVPPTETDAVVVRQHAIGLEIQSRTHLPDSSPLPDPSAVRHAGYVLSRISFRTILIKKWKQTYWAQYGPNSILFFRTEADFGDWLSNPYLTRAQREFLVKLHVDFVGDLTKVNVRGYQVTQVRLKGYKNKMMHQFKLERWMDYGPTIAAAFASADLREVRDLRRAMVDVMKNCPQDPVLVGAGGAAAGAGASGGGDNGGGQYGGGQYQYPSGGGGDQNGGGTYENAGGVYEGGGGGGGGGGDDGYRYGGTSSARRSQSVPDLPAHLLPRSNGGHVSDAASVGALDDGGGDDLSVMSGAQSVGGGGSRHGMGTRRTQSMGIVDNDYLGVHGGMLDKGMANADPYGRAGGGNPSQRQALYQSAR